MKLCLLLTALGTVLLSSSVCSEDCMTALQIIVATRNLCKEHRHNAELWQKVIDCHVPMSEEFMRNSGEAQCPIPKYVQDPTDTNYSIQDVFFNICGLFEGGFLDIIKGGTCLFTGKSNPPSPSHSSEVAAVKRLWGNDVPCNVGKCIMKLGLN